jgi:hypothetical protein
LSEKGGADFAAEAKQSIDKRLEAYERAGNFIVEIRDDGTWRNGFGHDVTLARGTWEHRGGGVVDLVTESGVAFRAQRRGDVYVVESAIIMFVRTSAEN